MSHEIETTGDKAAFASLRVPAWHKLGTVVQDEKTPHELLEIAHLSGWNVRAIPLNDALGKLQVGANEHIERQIIIRDNPFYDPTDSDSPKVQLIGDVGKNYTIGQNEELADFLDLVGARAETAGSLVGGTQVFMSGALEKTVTIDAQGANDQIDMYFMLYTSHDGSSNLVGAMTPVRVVCANTLSVAKRDMKPVIKIRHTKNYADRVEDAKAALNLQVKYIEKFAETANDLFEANVTDNEFDQIIKLAYSEPDKDASKGAVTRWQNKRDDLFGLWRGNTQRNIAGTGWAAFNALTEDQQWNRLVYKNNQENFFSAGSGFDDQTNKERNRLLKVVEDFVLV